MLYSSHTASGFIKVTEELIRKRSEHNEGLISSLEELSLHQQDVEKIEYLDKWCRDLRILYLQSNLIAKIENIGRLKKLEYLNLALNNIERIENLEGCESLTKLDFTVNFIGELTSIESLCSLIHLREIYLTGNPCTEFEGYWEYVIATLPQLQRLDGKEIERSDRIQALQVLHEIRPQILIQQEKYRLKREKEKVAAKKDVRTEKTVTEVSSNSQSAGNAECKQEDSDEEDDKKFWEEKVPYTPESRLRVHEHVKAKREKQEKKNSSSNDPVVRKLQADDGRILNVNEAKVDFTLTDSDDGNSLLLDIAIFKFLDTSLCDIDVQPTYVRAYVKGKVFQLTLTAEVEPSLSTAKRSQTTGHLLITMPKVRQVIKAPAAVTKPQTTSRTDNGDSTEQRHRHRQKLEVDPSTAKLVDVGNIVNDAQSDDVTAAKLLTSRGSWRSRVVERPNSDDFVDNDEVPPLI